MIKKLIGTGAVLAVVVPAVAQATVVIHISPGSVAPGGTVRVYGKVPGCPKGEQVTLISKAFKGSGHEFAGVPAVLTTVGKHSRYSVKYTLKSSVKPTLYKVSGRCGGGVFGSGGFSVS